MLNTIEKVDNVIKTRFLDKQLWMPLDQPLKVSDKEISYAVRLDDVICEDMSPDFDAYTIYMTRKCNYSCLYCFVDRNAKDTIFMVQELMRFIELRGRKKVQVRFFGGEPLLQFQEIRNWVANLDGMRDKGFSFSYGIVTNGSLLEPEVTDYLYKHRFIVILSHELNDGLQKINRRASNELQAKTLQNIKCLSKTKLRHKTTVRCMLDPSDDVTILDRLKYAVNMGISGVQFDIPHVEKTSKHRYTQEAVQELKRQIEEVTLFYLQRIEDRDYRYLGLYNIDNLLKIWILRKKYIDYDTCGFGINHFAIDVDGSFYPCQNFAGNKEFCLGNLGTGLDEKKFDTSMERKTKCLSCSVRELCTKRCYYSNYVETGNLYSPGDAQCEMKKSFISAAVYVLFNLLRKRDVFEDYCIMLKAKNRFLR